MRTEVHRYLPGEHCITLTKGTRVYRVIGPAKAALEGAKLAMAFLLASSCGASAREDFARDLAACELAPTCAEAVRCRTDAAVRYGRPLSTVGRCERGEP